MPAYSVTGSSFPVFRNFNQLLRPGLRTQIYLLGTSGLLLLGCIYLYGNYVQGHFQRAADESAILKNLVGSFAGDVLEARRLEVDFLLRPNESLVPLREAVMEDAAKQLAELDRRIAESTAMATVVEIAADRVAAISRTAAQSAAEDVVAAINPMRAAFNAYAIEFKNLVNMRKNVGFDETIGLLGALRHSAQDAESLVSAAHVARLSLLMVTMRKHEKDFLMGRDRKFIREMQAHAEEFEAALARSPLPPEIRSSIAEKMSGYQRDFGAVVEGVIELADESDDLKWAYSALSPQVTKVRKVVEAHYGDAQSAIAGSRAATMERMIWTILVATLGATAFALYVGRRLTLPLAAMARAMEKLYVGDTNVEVAKKTAGRRDEIGAIARAVEAFKQSIEENRRFAAEKEKATFLATMSHEIRTPMNGVRTIAELLADTPLNPDQALMVSTIKESADALVTVINDILDFSKIEAGRLEIDPRPFALNRLLDGVMTLLRPKADEKALIFVLANEIGANEIGEPAYRIGDAMRIRQILINLVGNAIKFTEHGQITLRIAERDEMVRFEIVDTGTGIDAEKIGQLFQPFQQAEASTAQRFGGTGLGLSICKTLCDLMGGSIGVKSVFGLGSTFWVALPLPATGDKPESEFPENALPAKQHWVAPEPAEAASKRAVVLCAEDNPTNRDVLARVLGRLGIVFEMAVNGVEALSLLDHGKHGLLLTDGHMPLMDGWELCERIRQMESENGESEDGLARLPVVAVTADALRGTEERCRKAGMDGYITKPLTIRQVEDQLLALLPILGKLRQPDEHRKEAAQVTVFPVETNVLELSALMDLVGPEFEIIEPMLCDFLSSAANLAAEVQAGVKAGDRTRCERAAHSLKGASRYVGAQKLGDTAATIEDLAKAGNIADAAQLSATLTPLVDEAAAAIGKLRVEDSLRQIPSGIDLSAVAGITENAAGRILEAAETIIAGVENIRTPDDAASLKEAVIAIFETCSFQDLASRRVRQTISRLAQIEEKLDLIMQGCPPIPGSTGYSFTKEN